VIDRLGQNSRRLQPLSQDDITSLTTENANLQFVVL